MRCKQRIGKRKESADIDVLERLFFCICRSRRAFWKTREKKSTKMIACVNIMEKKERMTTLRQ